jgi:hypothetical protein
MQTSFLKSVQFRTLILILGCCSLIACQTPLGNNDEQNSLTYHYTGWPKKSVERLLLQYMKSKQFLSSETSEGLRRFDRKGSNWDSVKYGSFLEPTAWIRLETELKEDKKSMQTTLHVDVSVITHRLSSLEEKRRAHKRHLEEASEVLRYFETMMLQSVSKEETAQPEVK